MPSGLRSFSERADNEAIDAHKFRNKHEVAEIAGVLQSVILYAAIVEAPTVDAVEVVRCKECNYGTENENGVVICINPHCGKSFYGCRVRPEHFCSYGERRENP